MTDNIKFFLPTDKAPGIAILEGDSLAPERDGSTVLYPLKGGYSLQVAEYGISPDKGQEISLLLNAENVGHADLYLSEVIVNGCSIAKAQQKAINDMLSDHFRAEKLKEEEEAKAKRTKPKKGKRDEAKRATVMSSIFAMPYGKQA